jgi:hypothetical protein
MEVSAAWFKRPLKFDENLVTKMEKGQKEKIGPLFSIFQLAASSARGRAAPSSRCVRRPMEIKWKMKGRQVQHSSSFFYRLAKHSQKGRPFSFVSCQHPPLDGASEPIILRGAEEGKEMLQRTNFKIQFFKKPKQMELTFK